jgi:hypothetical protein
VDLQRVEQEILTRLSDWRSMAARHTSGARQLLHQLLVDR